MSRTRPILTLGLSSEQDVVLAHQRARQVAGLLGLSAQDQTRVATAVSEIARNAYEYAGGGRVELGAELAAGAGPAMLTVRVSDRGPGVADLAAVLGGRYRSASGLGLGIVGARRLMDRFAVQSSGGGTVVSMAKALPREAPPLTPARFAALADALAREAPRGPLAELQQHNKDLFEALEALQAREEELSRLNGELEETNRGVLALYAELDDKAKALSEASEAKTRFLSNMSHEFRTPLNALLSLSGLLLDRVDGPLTDEQAKQVGFIRRSASGLLELVNDLLDIAKVEAGRLEARPAVFALADLFAGLRGTMRPLVPDGVTLTIEEPGDVELESDEGKLAQIMRNLVSNALKFTPAGEVRVVARPEGEGVALAVADTGVGIAPEDRERVFEEFAQVDHLLQRRSKGTGLGLPLARRLAELLGGRLTLESEVGVGSTFTLTLPRRLRAPGGPPPERPGPAGGPRPTVLVVDDDEVARYLLRDLLAPAGFGVIEAADGREGLARARTERPELVFLDLAMPGLSGYEVLEVLGADEATRGIPVIVHTASELGEAERGRLAGAVAVLSKGGSREETMAKVLAAVEQAGLVAPGALDG